MANVDKLQDQLSTVESVNATLTPEIRVISAVL